MDLGAGLGLLGFIAATNGAGIVDFVEPQSCLLIAERVAKDNQLTNCRFHNKSIEEISLDAPVDIILSVFTGNFLLTEDLLPLLFKARDRFLAEGGKLVPDRGRMIVQAVSHAEYHHQITALLDQDNFGINYQGLRNYLLNTAYYEHFNDDSMVALSKPNNLFELDFYTASSTLLDATVDIEIMESGICHGWLGWSDFHLGDTWLSTAPTAAKTHWRQVFFPLARPLPVTQGEKIQVRFQRPPLGDWTWTTTADSYSATQSTFHSKPVDLRALSQLRQDWKPTLNPRGDAARFILDKFTGGHTIPTLVRELILRYPDVFPDSESATIWVRKLASAYA